MPDSSDKSKINKMAMHLLEKTEEQINEEEKRKQQTETREKLLEAVAKKYKESESEMTERLTKIVSERPATKVLTGVLVDGSVIDFVGRFHGRDVRCLREDG